LYSGSYQNETGSDGLGDTPYVIDVNNQDNYPLIKPYPWASHDIGITSVTTSKTIVGQGYNVSINVMLFNSGIDEENVNITVYANTTKIGEINNINIASRNFTISTLPWNTTGFAKGTYTISACASVVPDETYTADNTFTDGEIKVTVPGDVNGNCLCDIQDISILVDKFLAQPPDPLYDPNCDINGDGVIDIADISIAVDNFHP
jgi:hypothetical protein